MGHVARRAADRNGVTHTERALGEEQDAADEIVDDVLEAEADADVELARR